MDARVEGLGLGSIQEINALPREVAEALYTRLVPEELLDRFANGLRTEIAVWSGDRAYRESLGLTAPEVVDLRRIEVQNEICSIRPPPCASAATRRARVWCG